ncbi:TPA: hypothetical protein DCX66_01555 [Candidatus Nomurabacteria bacterium]|nr:hypothetical protein [Candidatus Nomurabacteria bacterium]HAX65141.1 hypothetical protein [Candidatus Nomurabacteria bacterium]
MTQVITMNRYILNIFFLSITSLFFILYFKKTLTNLISKTYKSEFIFLVGISLIIHLISSYFILNYLNQPIWPFDSRGTSFLLMNNFYLWTKPFDVLLQQLLIVLLVIKLHQYKLTLKQITLLFVLGFGAIHIFQIFKTDIIIGLAFTLGAIISSFVYPYMILKVRNGYIYNFMIHMGIYNIAALLSYILY